MLNSKVNFVYVSNILSNEKKVKTPLKSELTRIKGNDIENAGPSIESPKRMPEKRNFSCFDTVPRLYSPINNYDIISIRNKQNKNPYRPSGLSSKEKCFIIYNCQNRVDRYKELKALANDAIKHDKIFTIYGDKSCDPIRKALMERGWVEKIPSHRMNLSKVRSSKYTDKTQVYEELEKLLLSQFVEKQIPHFLWRSRDELETTIDMTTNNNTIFNKLRLDTTWTTKQGLCSSVKKNYWFYIDNVAEVNVPRTYNVSYDIGDLERFIKDYKLTACTNLLKWALTMVAKQKEISASSGKISWNVLVFALNRCKEYLFKKQHKDIDENILSASIGQWNAYLKKSDKLISNVEIFQEDTENKLPLYVSYAKFLLKEIHQYRPQLSGEGCHNIWIVKPTQNSRGRGIKMASKLSQIMELFKHTNASYVIQKYIEEPLLIYNTKFDIRQYYLITSTYPLVIWMYKDCYLKFSSQRYDLKDFHESIHLTNNAIQRKYKNVAGRHNILPNNNMWESDQYKEYLNQIGQKDVWENIIYAGMRKSIVGVMLSCQDSMSTSKNRFELYGCDFLLDKSFKPWLIEINAYPDLAPTTQVTGKICPTMLTDLVKVVIDHGVDHTASTGKFECIYRQPMTIPRYGGTELLIRGYSLPLDYFYHGTSIDETFDRVNSKCDIKAILREIKNLYDVESVDKTEYNNLEYHIETSTHATISDTDISLTGKTLKNTQSVPTFKKIESNDAVNVINVGSSNNLKIINNNPQLSDSITNFVFQSLPCIRFT